MIVEKETTLDFPQQDGSTKRAHLLKVAKQTGNVPTELEVPEVHPSLMYVKNVFDELCTTREFVNGYPTLIKNADIYYWSKLTKQKLSTWHLTTIKRLDVSAINTLMKCIKETNNG